MQARKRVQKGPEDKNAKECPCVKLANNQALEFPVYGGSFQIGAKAASVISVEHGIVKKIRGKELPEIPEIGFAS